MVEAFSFSSVRASSISILKATNEWSPSKYYDKTQGEICFPKFFFLYYMHNLFWFLDVMCWVWHICYGCQFYQQFGDPTHVTIGIFEMQNTNGEAMAK
jgi:hypothetical protein